MADIHIGDFYKDVATIFVLLYNNFPRKTILYVEDISGPDEPDEFGLHSERFNAGFSTMVWLGDQNYLQHEAPIRQEALDQVVLTERGFLMLSSRSTYAERSQTDDNALKQTATLPSSLLDEAESNIAYLRKALRSGSSTKIRQCVLSMLNRD